MAILYAETLGTMKVNLISGDDFRQAQVPNSAHGPVACTNGQEEVICHRLAVSRVNLSLAYCDQVLGR